MRNFVRRVGLARMSGDAAVVALGELVAFAYPLVSIPLLSRLFGVTVLGQLIFAMAIIQISLMVVDFGFRKSALRRVILASSRNERAQIAGATITAKAIIFFAVVVLLVPVIVTVPGLREDWVLYAIGLATIIGNIVFPSWLLQGIGMMKTLGVLIAFSRVIALGGLLATVHGPSDVPWAMFWQFVPYAITALSAWGLLYLVKAESVVAVPLSDALAALADSAPLFVSELATSVINAMNTVVLGVFSIPAQVAFFGTAERVANAGRGILGSVQDAMLPRLARTEATCTANRAERWTVFVLVAGAFIAAGVGIIICAPWLIPWYLGPEFSPSVPVARILGAGLCVAAMTAVFTLVLVSRNQYRQLSRVMVIGAILHVVLLIPASIYWGALGAAVAATASEVLLVAMLGPAVKATGRSTTVSPSRQNSQAAVSPIPTQ